MKGTIVVDEIIVPIVDIYLDKGCIFVEGQRGGPVRAVNGAGYTVHDRCGVVVYRVDHDPALRWHKVYRGATLTVVVPLGVIDRTAVVVGGDIHPDLRG
jgi:hypothetical protein